MALHHPDKELHPNWTLDVGNNWNHKALTIMQGTKPTPEQLMYEMNMLISIAFKIAQDMRELDEKEKAE